MLLPSSSFSPTEAANTGIRRKLGARWTSLRSRLQIQRHDIAGLIIVSQLADSEALHGLPELRQVMLAPATFTVTPLTDFGELRDDVAPRFVELRRGTVVLATGPRGPAAAW